MATKLRLRADSLPPGRGCLGACAPPALGADLVVWLRPRRFLPPAGCRGIAPGADPGVRLVSPCLGSRLGSAPRAAFPPFEALFPEGSCPTRSRVACGGSSRACCCQRALHRAPCRLVLRRCRRGPRGLAPPSELYVPVRVSARRAAVAPLGLNLVALALPRGLEVGYVKERSRERPLGSCPRFPGCPWLVALPRRPLQQAACQHSGTGEGGFFAGIVGRFDPNGRCDPSHWVVAGSAAARRGAVGAGSGVPRCGQEGGQEGSGGGVLGPVGADHPSARPAAGLGRGGPHRHPAPHLAGPRRTTDDDAAPDALRRLAAGRLRSCLATPRRHDTTDTTDRHARRRRGARRRCGARRPTPCGAPARGSGSGGGPRYEKAGESSPTSRPGARCPPGRSGPTSGPPPRARGP